MFKNISAEQFPGFRTVPKTGVIYVTSEAMKRGFSPRDSSWANLGQGAPEVGPINHQTMPTTTLCEGGACDEYTPVAGLYELRHAIAELYNKLFRKDKKSHYTAENVAIASGGRAGLTRIAATLGDIHIGHLIPDYTAYEELLTTLRGCTPIPLLLDEQKGYALSADALREMIHKLGLGAVLMSNPSNPTGHVTRGGELAQYVDAAHEERCALILDEFYSHYVYTTDENESDNIVSAARYIDDVDRDPVIILDGLTKNWRRPGWRISWTLAPKEIIERIASAGSFLDGGAPHPLQHATLSLISPERVREGARLLQAHYVEKRALMLDGLARLGIEVAHPPAGSFYCWARLDELPEPLNNGMRFFSAGLDEKVITVPGEFFDVNPGKRRKRTAYQNYARISFGPSKETLNRGLAALERTIASAR
ncbi:MAG: pyridoxal phosphate-dependent aminotransferase [Patescibacteria group bacterium]